MKCGLVVHVPHASLKIPDEYRSSLLLNDDELARELIQSTDAYCDELFETPLGVMVTAEYSRFVCDVERFRDDEMEPCAKKGNGFFYTHTYRGKHIRNEDPSLKMKTLTQIYDVHHKRLTEEVEKVLSECEKCLIIDGHSFWDDPLLGNDFCDFDIGTDAYHTPDYLAGAAVDFFRGSGFSVELNKPFAGSIVPMKFYGKEKRVASIMIEVNRRLYLKHDTMDKSEDFVKIKDVCGRAMEELFNNCNRP